MWYWRRNHFWIEQFFALLGAQMSLQRTLIARGRTGGRAVVGNISASGFPVSSAIIRATSLEHVCPWHSPIPARVRRLTPATVLAPSRTACLISSSVTSSHLHISNFRIWPQFLRVHITRRLRTSSEKRFGTAMVTTAVLSLLLGFATLITRPLQIRSPRRFRASTVVSGTGKGRYS